MSKKRKKKLAAQPQVAKQRDTKPASESKTKVAAPAGKARRWVWSIAIVLLVAAALLMSQTLFGKDAARPSSPWTLTILHTTDVEGYLDPCG